MIARGIVLALVWLMLLACAGANAQAFSMQSGREAVISLTGLWRFRTGDDPAWARPGFDDSHWPLVRSDESWTEQGYPAFNGYAWYRFKIEMPGDGKPVGLLLPGIVNGYELYIDGQLIGSEGSAGSTRDPVFSSLSKAFRLPPGSAGPHVVNIALRVWAYRPIAVWYGSGPVGTGGEAGDPAILATRHRQELSALSLNFVNEFCFALVSALVGLAILALFLLHPGDKEYLWFSILLLGLSVSLALHIVLNLGQIPFSLWRFLSLMCDAASQIAALQFFAIILCSPKSFFWWTACIAAAAIPLTTALIYFQWTSVGISYAIEAALLVPAYCWIITKLTVGVIRRDAAARLLIVPVVLYYGAELIDLIARIVWQLGGSRNHFSADRMLFTYPFPITLVDGINYVYILALLIFLVRRFSLARKEEERLASEFEAAKTIQALLIPAVPPKTPGFDVESVYLPASEVGGDFFQVLPAEDGSLLIVVGDVSGKGLKAAMTVSTIVGGLRNCRERKPADVLARLNGVLFGHVSGFVTCAAALITLDGHVTLSNAGHIAPYRNGNEMAVGNSLPLGLVAETGYEETHGHLAPGDRLTFVSDGVVEAKNERREIFGFDRTRMISNQPAHMISEQAKRFGQEDDISVVSVKRNPAFEAVSA
jgi:hypothetical protein